jgi:hypothetical protein
MNQSLPTRAFRGHTDLNQLKRQAKELLEAFRGGESATAAEVHAHYRGADAGTFTLHEAQLVLARAYGFASWPKLKAYVDGITAKRLVEAVRAGDLPKVQAMLRSRPELVNMDMGEDEHRDSLRRVESLSGNDASAHAAWRRCPQGNSSASRCD